MKRDYIENIKSLLDGTRKSVNYLEHDFVKIIRETRKTGCTTRDYILMKTTYFLRFDEFKSDWPRELNRFCLAFGMYFHVINNGRTIEFRYAG